jgi:DNA-binding PadR family transcriptional regulator
MPIQHAVLGLLDTGPRHGYRLRQEFEAAVGPGWGGLNIGHLTQILERLSRDGLIASKAVPQQGNPDRLVHRITPAGRRDLDDWLFSPAARSAGFRDDFLLKVLVATSRSADDVRQVCRIQQDLRIAELHTLEELRSGHSADPLAALTIEAAILHTRADLELIEVTEARADELHLPETAHPAEQGSAAAERSVG